MSDEMTYINYNAGRFRIGFAFFDLPGEPACDKIMDEKGIFKHAKFTDMKKDGAPYMLVMCTVPKKHASVMRECIEELKRKMLLTGHTDYVKEWASFTESFESDFEQN